MVKNLPTVERSTRIRFGKNCKDDQAENTIVFNASNVQIEANTPGAVYLTPIRLRENYEDPNIVLLMYNKETNEITESGEAATDIIQPSLESATRFGNVSSVSTVQFNNALTSFVTLSNVGIANAYPQHTLDIGANVAIDVVGSNVISVLGGNVYIQKDLVVDGNTRINGNVTVVNTENLSITDAIVELGRNNTSGDTTLDLGLLMNRPNSNVVIGFREGTNEIVLGYTQSSASNKTFTPKTDEDIDVHVYGRVLTEANVGIINTNPIHTLDVGSNLYVDEFGSNILVVRGNTNVTGDLTVDTNTLFVDSVENKVGIKTVNPDAELHVVGNVYVSKDLTVTENALVSNNLTVTKDLTVNENAYVTKDLTVTENALVSNNLTVTKDLTVNENAYVTKDLTVTENALVSNNLTVTKDLTVTENALVSNNLTVTKDLTVTENALVSNNLTVTKDLTVNENAYVTKDLTVTENALVSNNLTVTKDLTVNENAYVTKDLTVTENALVSNNLTVTKDLTVTENALVSNNLTVTKDLTVTENALVSNNLTVTKDLTVTENAYVTKDLTVTENALVSNNLTVTKDLTVTENAYVTKDLTVTENALVSNNLTVTKDLTVTENALVSNNLTVTKDLTVTENALVSNNLTVTKDLTVTENALVSNNLTVTKDLTVTENAYVTKDLTVTENALVSNNLTVTKDLTVTENAYVTKDLTVTENALVSNNLTVTKDLTVTENAYVTKDLTVTENALVSNNLTVTKDLTVTENALVSNNLTVTKDLTVTENALVSNNLTVTKDLTVTENALVSNNLTVTKDLTVTENALVSNNLTVTKDLTVTENALVSNNLTVTKDLTVTENAYVTKDLTVTENALVSNNLTVTKDLTVTENAYVTKDLTVTENALVSNNLTVTKDLTVTENALVSNNLTVTKDLTVNKNAFVSNNLTVSNTLTLNDPTTALVTDLTSNVLVKLDQLSNVVINTTDPNESLRDEHILVYDGTNWINDYPKHAYVKVYNDSGEDMEAGNVVYVSGIHNQNLMEVALAKSDSATTMPAIGIVTSAIVSGEEGFAVTYGKVPTVSVDDFIVGETVYVSNVHAGLLTNVKPYVTTTDLIQNVGIVTKSGNGKGALFVTGIGRANDVPNAQIVSELQDMQYVYVNNTNNDFKKIHHQNILYGGNFYKSLVKTFNITNITAYNETSLVGTYPLITNATGGKLRITYSSAESDTDDLEWNLQRKKGDTGTNQTVTFVGGGGSVDAIVDAEWLDGFEQFVLTGNNFSSSANLIVNVTEVELIPDFEFTKGKVDIGSVVVTDTTDTTSSTSGALVVAGGVGIAKDIQVGSNISVAGLKDATNKHLVMTETNGKLTKAPAYVNNDNKFVITAAEAEFLGNLTLSGNTTVVTSNSVTIEDRIFGVAANNSTEGLDSGFMIEHQDDGKYSNIALIYHSNDHRFSIGHTQNTFTDDHILHYQDPLGMKIDLRGDVTVQNTTTLNKTLDVTGVTTLKNDLVVGAASNLFVDVSNSRVGINEASPKKSLDVNGTGRFKDTTDSSSTGTGALLVLGGLGVASNIHATNVYAGSHIGVGLGTASTTVPLEVRASGTGGILVKHTGTAASNHAKLALESNTTTGGDPYITMVVSGGSTFAVGVDNSDSDTFKISQESTLGTNDRLKITTAGVTTVTNTTEATSTGTGALVVSGGLGVASNVNATNVYALGTTNATSKTSGSLQVRGGLGVSGNVYAAKIHTDDYLTHTGDLNTRVGFPVADTFVVETGGTERVRVDSAGRLGVGTTSPSEKISIGFGSDDYPTIEFVNTGTNITRRPASDDYDAYFRGLETTIQRRADVETAFSGTGPVIENSHEIVFGYGEGYDVFTSDDTRYPSYHAMKFNVWSLTRGSGSLTNVMNLLGNGNVGIGTTTPGHTLGVNGTVSVTSGTIINTEQVAKKTYSFSNTIATGSEPEINVYFSSNVFYSKITAQLNDLDNEVSTLVIECSGGSRKGTPLNVAIGTKNIFGGVSTNPWSSTVKVDTDHISFTPSAVIDNTSGGDYHVFIEYTSPDATLGKVTRITKDGSNDVTFDY
jgi:UDP-3-O-[3-hydroxymyristoyl] glucosamine N-acyltransferase